MFTTSQGPRRLLIDIPVRLGDDAPDTLQRNVKDLLGDERSNPIQKTRRLGKEPLVGFRETRRARGSWRRNCD